MSDTERFSYESEAAAQQRREQADALRPIAEKAGLRCTAYLPPALATWVLDLVAKGDFVDPSEAIFTFLSQAMDLEPHDDLKQAILTRRIDRAMADTGRTYSLDEVRAHLEANLADRTEPAEWNKIDLDIRS